MTSLLPSGAAVETFTGADGSAPNATNWTVARNEGTGGGITIQSNRCRLRCGTVGGNRISLRVTGITALADSEIVFDWDVTPSMYPTLILRSDSQISTVNGYTFSLRQADMIVSRRVSPGFVDLVTYTHGFVYGDQVRTRVAIFGQRIRARTWDRNQPEPTGVWQIDYTDTGGITAGGYVGITMQSTGSTSGSLDFFIDNLSLTDTLTPTQATLNAVGSITPTGQKIFIPKKLLAGVMTPGGALIKSRAVYKVLTGTITPVGVLVKNIPRFFAGSIALTGNVIRKPNKKFTGVITPAGLYRKALVRKFAGTITPTGAGTPVFIGRIYGRPGVVVMTLIQRASVAIRHRKG
jgi:hypothetical protein